jgi:hypothetical protein
MALSDFTFRSVAVEETTLLYRLNRYARGRVPARAGGATQDYEKGKLTINLECFRLNCKFYEKLTSQV